MKWSPQLCCFVGALSLSPLALVACSDAPEPPPRSDASAESERDARIVAEFRRDMTAILRVAQACETDRSPECLERSFAAIRAEELAPRATASGAVSPRDWWRDTIGEIGNWSKQRICRKLSWAIPFTRRYAGDVRLYHVVGVTAGGGAVASGFGGAEAVWELNHNEAAAFTYQGAGVGNVAGGSAGVYTGLAISALGGDVISNWSGHFVSVQVGVSIPETDIGVDAIQFNGLPLTSPRRVQGLSVGASIGVNFLNPAVAVAGTASYYRPNDETTTAMNGRGALSVVQGSAGKTFRKFRSSASIAGFSLSAGGLQALDILWYGASAPQLAAATIAYGIDKLNASGLGLEAWCAGAVAVGPCGGGDVDTASTAGGGLHPLACAGEPVEDDEPTIEERPPACATDADCGASAVCDTSEGSACCRATFEPAAADAVPCYADAECPSGFVCGKGARIAAAPDLVFTCIDPKAHPCADGKL